MKKVPVAAYDIAKTAHEAAIRTLEPTSSQLHDWLRAEAAFAQAEGFQLLVPSDVDSLDVPYACTVTIRIAQALADVRMRLYSADVHGMAEAI